MIKNPVSWLSNSSAQPTRSVDSNAIWWLTRYVRDPNPKHLIWSANTHADTREDRAHTHYWLQNTSEHQQISVRVVDNVLVIEQATPDFTIMIDPDVVDLRRAVSVVYNDTILFSGMIEPDLRYLAQGLLQQNDLNLAYVGAIPVAIPSADQKQ